MKLPLYAALLVLLTGGSPAQACTGATISAAWVRSPPPGMTMTAAYFELRNDGAMPLVIESISSADFGSTMLHETVYRDGEAHMQHLAVIAVAPGETFRATPGSVHVMVADPLSEISALKTAGFELHCTGGGTLAYRAAVLRSAPDIAETAP